MHFRPRWFYFLTGNPIDIGIIYSEFPALLWPPCKTQLIF